jgi:UDP-N-acetylglucosamine 4-epimerase
VDLAPHHATLGSVPRSIADPALACHEANVTGFVNQLAATTDNPAALNQICNVAVAERTTLNELFELERALLIEHFPQVREYRPRYREFRDGDVRHSQADISKACKLLGYAPTHRVREGLKEAMGWYAELVAAGMTGSARSAG